MTFIASVIAKNGVAIIADSLVTSMSPVIEYRALEDYLSRKEQQDGDEIKVNVDELMELFTTKPSHTKDYEEKLFQFDEFIAITTAGSAVINGKRIVDLIVEAKAVIFPDKESKRKSFETKLGELKSFIEDEVKAHLVSNNYIGWTTFIITSYDKETKNTAIHSLDVLDSSQESMAEDDYELVSVFEQPKVFKVVCAGQNRISESILFGNINAIQTIVPAVIKRVATDFGLPDDKVDTDYVTTVLRSNEMRSPDMLGDIKMNKLTSLSLQQAVDLAYLLMRIEIDMQKYTENIPTVGGVIKLAVIDDKGFKFIAGDKVVNPLI